MVQEGDLRWVMCVLSRRTLEFGMCGVEGREEWPKYKGITYETHNQPTFMLSNTWMVGSSLDGHLDTRLVGCMVRLLWYHRTYCTSP